MFFIYMGYCCISLTGIGILPLKFDYPFRCNFMKYVFCGVVNGSISKKNLLNNKQSDVFAQQLSYVKGDNETAGDEHLGIIFPSEVSKVVILFIQCDCFTIFSS